MVGLGLLGLVFAALFSGAAIYINWAEHPARTGLSPESALAQWRPAYARGFQMQASLAVAGGLAAIGGWLLTGRAMWLAGGIVLLLNWPYTLVAIMPVNRKLAADQGSDGAATLQTLQRWNRLHGGRSLLGLLSLILLFLGAL